ncbi:MAG TPA: diacylglycerol kinase family protein [Streptosporangiaceae bacterium]|nr:diacylglycerol kinase family protein [Streptosporangiaceae bacterium]
MTGPAPANADVPLAAPRGTRSQRWLARLSFLLAALAIAVVVAFAGLKSIAMLAVGLAAAAVGLAAAFFFLSRRGVVRWLSLALFVLAPIAVIAAYAFAALLWVAVVSAAGWLLAALTARAALAGARPDWRMPEAPAVPAARHPFLIMNPKSGGGKVERFGLVRRAEALGADVYLMSGPDVDVAEVARKAVAAGADLLGVAGGDGTQALVAGVAAEHGIPFMVITAGTRNHFALDLGLDRADPAACLGALSDAVELRVDLGVIGGQTFVNNASFGAYAEVVQTPAYRGDKLGTTLDMLPDLLQGHRGARLTARADGVTIDAPQAVLVANNPYGMGDIAGLGRRMRLDRGVLGVVAVTVGSARQAAGLLRGRRADGVRALTTRTVVVTADSDRIPVGIDGEAVAMPVPVDCAVRPGALRVRVPRYRPGVPPPRASISWSGLRHLAVGKLGANRVAAAYERLTELGDVLARARDLSVQTLIFDVEPLVAWWDSDQQSLDRGIAAIVAEVSAIPAVRVVVFATNSARRLSALPVDPARHDPRVIYLASAGKPLRTAAYRGLPGPGAVIGDQVPTDGLLAHRLGYTFLHWSPGLAGVPLGPRLMHRLGRLARPLLFRRDGTSRT